MNIQDSIAGTHREYHITRLFTTFRKFQECPYDNESSTKRERTYDDDHIQINVMDHLF